MRRNVHRHVHSLPASPSVSSLTPGPTPAKSRVGAASASRLGKTRLPACDNRGRADRRRVECITSLRDREVGGLTWIWPATSRTTRRGHAWPSSRQPAWRYDVRNDESGKLIVAHILSAEYVGDSRAVHGPFPPQAVLGPPFTAGGEKRPAAAPRPACRRWRQAGRGAGRTGCTGRPVLTHGPITADAEEGRERPCN